MTTCIQGLNVGVSLCLGDLIRELYGESVRIVDGWMVRLKGDRDVLALSWSNAALYWHHTEHTQSAVVLGSCTGYKRQCCHFLRLLLLRLLLVLLLKITKRNHVIILLSL